MSIELLQYDFYLFGLLIFLYLFIYSALGLFSQKNNILRILFLFELMILIMSFMFLVVSLHYGDLYGHIVVMYLLTIAAVEASIGLALIYIYYRVWGTIKLQKLSRIKG